MKVILQAILSFCFLSLSLQAYSLPEAKPVSQAKTQAQASVPGTPPASHSINLNTADAKTLSKSIKGIGIKRAESIVRYREENHGFKAVTELSEVPLLGKNFVSKHLKEIEETFTVN